MNYLMTEGIYIMYLRKSRADERLGIENVLQKHEIELQLLAKREIGYSIPEKYIFREIVSGSTIKDRPLIKEILKIMESGTVKGVLVVDPQRLTRGDMLDQGHIINAFKYTDTLIMTPFKTYNLNDPTGNDMKLLKMELDHGADYLDYYKMIQKRGKYASLMEGNFINAIPPYGYKKVCYVNGGKKIHTLEPVPEQAEIVRMIFDKCLSGMSNNQIAKELNESGVGSHTGRFWDCSVIRRLLDNPVYDGKVRWDNTHVVSTMDNGTVVDHRVKNSDFRVFEGKHDAIVSHEVFTAVQEILKDKRPFSENRTIKNPLAGIFFCSKCGRIMKAYRSKPKCKMPDVRYTCSNNLCKIKSSTERLVLNTVIDSLQRVVNDFELIIPETESLPDPTEKIDSLKDLLRKLNLKEETQFELLETKTYSIEVFTMRHAELEKQRQEITNEIQRLSNQKHAESRQEKKARFKDALEALKDPSIPGLEKNKLLKNCIEKIYYNVESNKRNAKLILDIHFKF